MGTATDTSHDIWTQGAGLVNALNGVLAATDSGAGFASPSSWSVMDNPGSSTTETFGISGGIASVSATTHSLIGVEDYSFTSADAKTEHGLFTTPDYVLDITGDIPAGTDLLEVRLAKPFEQFNPEDSLLLSPGSYNNWRVHLQNWTDLNTDGAYRDGSAVVEGTPWEQIAADGDMQTGEHIRFTYGYSYGPTQQARVASPLERMSDGVLLTLRHRDTGGVPQTDLAIEAWFWEKSDWQWLTLSDDGSTVTATVDVPPGTPFGMYEGSIEVTTAGGSVIVIPVSIAVSASGPSVTFGGVDQSNRLYDNGSVLGYTDYSWRAESGDWRFFWTDIAEADIPDTGTSFLVVDNEWSGDRTDIDTTILGPGFDDFSGFFGPTLEEIGRSEDAYIGSGRWAFSTSSGGSRDLVSAPIELSELGLDASTYEILLHQVMVDGERMADSFSATTGLVNVDPGMVVGEGSGSVDVTISSEIDLDGFVAEGFGLGGPTTSTGTVSQDDPDDPSTASFTTTVTIEHGALLEVATGNSAGGSDLDLYLYGPEGDLVASSTTPDDEEFVSVVFPEDGTYTIAVHGWSVPTGTDTFELTVNAVQGFDVNVTSLPDDILAGSSGVLTIEWDVTGFEPGTYGGLVLLGPSAGPGLLQVPIEVTVPTP